MTRLFTFRQYPGGEVFAAYLEPASGGIVSAEAPFPDLGLTGDPVSIFDPASHPYAIGLYGPGDNQFGWLALVTLEAQRFRNKDAAEQLAAVTNRAFDAMDGSGRSAIKAKVVDVREWQQPDPWPEGMVVF